MSETTQLRGLTATALFRSERGPVRQWLPRLSTAAPTRRHQCTVKADTAGYTHCRLVRFGSLLRASYTALM